MPRAGYIPKSRYYPIWRRIQKHGIVGCYGLKSERTRATNEEEAALIAQWPKERIRGLSDKCKVPHTRLAALLGVNKRTHQALYLGEYTPSPRLCKRMELLERQAAEGLLFPKIVPSRSEARRRLMLFRAWWYQQPPSQTFPEVELDVRVRWGGHAVQTFKLPVTLLPRMKLTKWSGLAELVKEITLAARRASKAHGLIAWKTIEAEFWRRYTEDTLPGVILDRAQKQQAGNRAKKKEK